MLRLPKRTTCLTPPSGALHRGLLREHGGRPLPPTPSRMTFQQILHTQQPTSPPRGALHRGLLPGTLGCSLLLKHTTCPTPLRQVHFIAASCENMAGGRSHLHPSPVNFQPLPQTQHHTLPRQVHFIVASCENMVDGRALRPGDILVASNGKSVEVVNTDAEGRLTLVGWVGGCRMYLVLGGGAGLGQERASGQHRRGGTAHAVGLCVCGWGGRGVGRGWGGRGGGGSWPLQRSLHEGGSRRSMHVGAAVGALKSHAPHLQHMSARPPAHRACKHDTALPLPPPPPSFLPPALATRPAARRRMRCCLPRTSVGLRLL